MTVLSELSPRDHIAITHLVMTGLARHEGHAEAIVRQLNEHAPLVVYVLLGQNEVVGAYTSSKDADAAEKVYPRSTKRVLLPLNAPPKVPE